MELRRVVEHQGPASLSPVVSVRARAKRLADRAFARSMSWIPILSGPAQERTLALASRLAQLIESVGPRTTLDGVPPHFSVVCGAASTALLLDQCHRSERGSDDACVPFLEYCAERLQAEPAVPGLFGGFSGTAWVFEHLLADEDPTVNADVDDRLLELVSAESWTDDYDLISGLAGIGVYCASRRSDVAREATRQIVRHLRRLAVFDDDARCAWLREARWLHPSVQARFPEGYFDLGVAHGSAGVIGFLALACSVGHEPEIESLLHSSVEWLLAQRTDSKHRFPYVVSNQHRNEGGRGVWCNGDLGIAMSLLLASDATGCDSWRDEAVTAAKNALLIHHDQRSVNDACLCHGSAGIAQVAMRLFNRTRDEFFRTEARLWIDDILNMHDPDGECGGFVFLHPQQAAGLEVHRDSPFRPSSCFLTGITGVALVLLSASSRVEPAWDRLILCS